VVGNHYSLKGKHERAVLYFQRAIKLNARCVCLVPCLTCCLVFVRGAVLVRMELSRYQQEMRTP
jgi:hypothetical protein